MFVGASSLPTHHVLVIVKVLDGLLGTADLIVISLGGYVEVIEGQRPERGEKSAVDVVPDLAQVEWLGCLNQRVDYLLTGSEVARLTERERQRKITRGVHQQ